MILWIWHPSTNNKSQTHTHTHTHTQNKKALIYFVCLFVFQGNNHMYISRIGVESSQSFSCLLTPVTAIRDWSHICDLHHNSQKCQVLNPLGKARDQTWVLMDTTCVCNPWSHSDYSPKQLLCSKIVSTKWKWKATQKIIWRHHMIQQSYFWVYTVRKWSHYSNR